MKINLHINPMRAMLLVLLIVSISSPVQCSAQTDKLEKPNIGLIRFSVDVFDKQKKLVEKERVRVENRLKKFLKDDLKCDQVLYLSQDNDVIAYSDIEDPDVTLDPLFESRADKKLKEFSVQNKLAAIVFGHFKEEDELIVVFRCYLADDSIPIDKRIISTKSKNVKIDKDIAVNLQNTVNELALELEKELKYRFVNNQPEDIKNNEGKPEVKAVDLSKENETQHLQSEKANETGGESSSILDVYQMIIDNGFHCEILRGSPNHDEAMKIIEKSRKTENDIFHLKRDISSKIIKQDIIETESTIEVKTGKKNETNIKIHWFRFEKGKIPLVSFGETQNEIEKLNAKMIEQGRVERWRMPTLKELLAITTGKEPNRFPWSFELPEDKELLIWSKTKVENENDGYFILRRKYDNNRKNYTVHFMQKNIGGGNKEKAYLLPVYNGQANKVPGFDDVKAFNKDTPGTSESGEDVSLEPKFSSPNVPQPPATPINSGNSESDKIPGFDDVPESDKTSTNKSLPQGGPPNATKLQPKKVKISLIPYFVESLYATRKEREMLININLDIENALKSIVNQVRSQLYCELLVDNIRIDNSKNSEMLTNFFHIVHPSPHHVSREKVEEIIQKIMIPEEINIIISVIPAPVDTTQFNIYYVISLVNPISLSSSKTGLLRSGDIQDLMHNIKKELECIQIYKKVNKSFGSKHGRLNE